MKIEPRQNHNECFHCGLQKGTIEDTGVRCANGHEHQFKDGGAPVSKQNPARMSEELKKEYRGKIGELVGEASMCWTELPQGVFESERAKRIVDDIMLILAKQQEEFVRIVERVEKVNDSNGRYNACQEILADIKSKLVTITSPKGN